MISFFRKYLSEVAVAITLLCVTYLGHEVNQILEITDEAEAHMGDPEIHAPVQQLEQRMDSLEENLADMKQSVDKETQWKHEQWEEQHRVNQRVLQSLGQIQGAMNQGRTE